MVIHAGHNGQPVFLDATDRQAFLSALRDAARAAKVGIHAYGLQAAEVRLLASPETEGGLSEMMQTVGRRYARLFNQRHGRSGSPWEGRFRSTVIETPERLLACMRFVESESGSGVSAETPGPADDGVSRSSAPHHLRGASDLLVTEHPGFWALGNTPFDREAAYRRFLAEPAAPPEMAAILHATRNGWVLGSQAFADWVGDHTGRRPVPAKRGRPRKLPL